MPPGDDHGTPGLLRLATSRWVQDERAGASIPLNIRSDAGGHSMPTLVWL